ncbi:MAG: DUF3999 domain-containing protein [Gammaproteobacteria bacterium]|nr:DUF3999 domain-containing protein [Gammaproteobacteria bacterium]
MKDYKLAYILATIAGIWSFTRWGINIGEMQARIEYTLIGYQVVTGDVMTLGGTQALSGRIIADWKQWPLWGLLIAATLLLGWMAFAASHGERSEGW